MISNRPESKRELIYWCSSCKFKTQKEFKAYIYSLGDYSHLKFKIRKG